MRTLSSASSSRFVRDPARRLSVGWADYLLGHSFALNQVEDRLDHYANRILLETVTSSAESRAILATMNSSTYYVLFRRRNRILPSTHLPVAISEGRRSHARWKQSNVPRPPAAASSPNRNTPRTSPGKTERRVYKNLSPFRVDDQDVISVQAGRFIRRLQPLQSGFAGGTAHALHRDGRGYADSSGEPDARRNPQCASRKF